MRLGEIDVEPVHDGTVFFAPTDVLPNTSDAQWEAHRDLLTENGMLAIEIGGFLVRTADRVALVDTGVGTMKGPFTGEKFLDSLATLGVAPAEVTDVLLTHLHYDHVGWTTRKGAIVFPNATYRCHEQDWAHFVGPDAPATKKLAPLVDQLETWSAQGTVLPGVDVLPAPGHTPGSTVVVLSSGTQRALLLGDVAHCPAQLVENEWAALFDVDPAMALQTRTALARELEGGDVLAAGTHFPGMRFGRLVAGKGKRRWVLD
jgi:glyoxylase-like metal-dependent hydrolase (beta-lactamase superfamily II)